MMVTFVSQCEKNALKKTRRVLDAFANRIGNNTWQTIITEDGLITVKKMLRQTASRSTAVSCHWIRSRSRSQFLWVVGAKRKFNGQGVVPVNTTEKEVFMDIKQAKAVKGVLYANTHLQLLDQHLFAVGYLAEKLYLTFYPEKKNQAKAAFISGCMHDIGKLDPCFQAWVIKPKNKTYQADDGQHIDDAKFSFEKHPRHNETSVLIFQCLSNSAKSISSIKPSVRHAIYWHHAKAFRIKEKDGFDTYGKVYSKLKTNLGEKAERLISQQSIEMLNAVCEIDKKYRKVQNSSLQQAYDQKFDNETLLNYKHTPLPSYKEYLGSENLDDYGNEILTNAHNNEIRACLITADRWISSLSANDLSSHIQNNKLDQFVAEQLDNKILIESNLKSHIQSCIASFPNGERSKKQSIVAKKLADDIEHVKVLAGAAGCGKTKIALEWASLRNAQQIIWVCPRVQICQGIFTELKASNEPYLQDASVEIFTGEYKYTNNFETPTPDGKQLTADIVITTIDQLLSGVISHTNADRLLNYLSAHVVFDEFHEYINIPAFNLLFGELVTSRNQLHRGCNALLVSATPNYFYLENFLNLDVEFDVVEMPSFNDKNYQFDFVEYDENREDETNPLYNTQPLTTFTISNTATTAQKSFIHNLAEENAVLLHSKYKKSDKQKLFTSVFESFGRNGDQMFQQLRSGPIVQASLNISCDYMISEITTAENCLQRMGRLDRFGKNDDINTYTIAVPESIYQNRGSGAVARFLSSSHSLLSAKAWYQFLIDQTDNGNSVFTIPDIYHLYKNFYKLPAALAAIEQDSIAAMKKSAMLITSKLSEPQTMISRKKSQTQRVKIGSNSLRGDSRFVQMAVVKIDSKTTSTIIEDYAYTIPVNDIEPVDNLTFSTDLIQGYGDSTNNLLTYMVKKHHNIMGGVKPYKDFILLNDAKSPEFPIYLSYTPNDLLAVGGESARHNSAIYYAVSAKQPIGAISNKNLTTQED